MAYAAQCTCIFRWCWGPGSSGPLPNTICLCVGESDSGSVERDPDVAAKFSCLVNSNMAPSGVLIRPRYRRKPYTLIPPPTTSSWIEDQIQRLTATIKLIPVGSRRQFLVKPPLAVRSWSWWPWTAARGSPGKVSGKASGTETAVVL